MTDAWRRVCSVADVAEDRPLGVEVEGQPIGIFREGSQCYALEDVCTHAFAQLSNGWISEGAVECPLHAARFDLKTGKCVSTPSYEPVRTYEVRVEDGEILVKLDEG
jgi:NAD(P)H-dependent nitrite reductase small subunit